MLTMRDLMLLAGLLLVVIFIVWSWCWTVAVTSTTLTRSNGHHCTWHRSTVTNKWYALTCHEVVKNSSTLFTGQLWYFAMCMAYLRACGVSWCWCGIKWYLPNCYVYSIMLITIGLHVLLCDILVHNILPCLWVLPCMHLNIVNIVSCRPVESHSGTQETIIMALSQPHSVCAEITWGMVSSHHPTRPWGAS